MAQTWRPAIGLIVVFAALIWAAGCTSQQERSLSALHYFQRGNAAFQAEDFGGAIAHYQMALKFDADAPDIHYNLGLAYYRAGAYEDAVAAYQDALRLDPEFADAHLNLALVQNKLYNSGAANLHYNRYRALVMGTREDAAAAASTPRPAGPGGKAPATIPDSEALQAARQMNNAAPKPTAGAPPSPPASNPFQGNSKWWTQDTADLNR